MTYAEKLKDPRWQQRRQEILRRDKFACQHCLKVSSSLHVHHRYYKENREPWEYEDSVLISLCQDCHELEHMLYERDQRLKRNLNAVRGEENYLCGCCGHTEFRIKGLHIICKMCGYDKDDNS